MNICKLSLLLTTCFTTALAYADITIPMYLTAPKGTGKQVGVIVAKDTSKGLLLTPDLHGLLPGTHGFHVHQNPSCDNLGMAAGGHLDPAQTQQHKGPNADGHLGDLPTLLVNPNGDATTAVLAPHLKEADIAGHALMIHVGGDNYSDKPELLGGGGARMVCGVVPKN